MPSEAWQEYHDLRRLGKLKRADISQLCQADVNLYAEHCFDVVQQPVHLCWQEIADREKAVVFYSPPEHGKTFQFGHIRLGWELGRNPTGTFAHFGSGANIPAATLRLLVQHLAKNDKCREVFPNLKIADFKQDEAGVLSLWIERPGGHIDRDATVVATGVLKQILGRRLDWVLLDDVLNIANTYTRGQRQKFIQLVDDQILSRLSAEASVYCIGHPWQKDDMSHWLAAKPGWTSYRFDVEHDLDGNPGPPAALWPTSWRDPRNPKRVLGWPWERIMSKRDNTDPLTWWRVWKCRTPRDEMELFPSKLIHEALERGRGLQIGREMPLGIMPVSGIDPATGDGNDSTCITTGYMSAGQRHVLDIRGGLWDDARLFREMRDVLRKYPEHGGFLVEDNGFQKLLVRTLQRRDVMRAYGWRDEDLDRCRVFGFTTTAARKVDAHLGIKSLAIDLQTSALVLPSDANGHAWPATDRLVQGMQDYDPNEPTRHASDYLMSYWLCCEMMRRLGQEASSGRHLGIS